MKITSRNTLFLCNSNDYFLFEVLDMLNNDDNTDGIFVVNGQIFSATDLLDVMRRHGIRIRVSRDGLNVDGEQISSISHLDHDKCPLASTCEKRVALVEFLKLQKSQDRAPHRYDDNSNYSSYSERDGFMQQDDQEDDYEFDRDTRRSDFIRPNNHDLFEGNVSQQAGLFDEPSTPTRERGLFDEPDLFSDSRDERPFEETFYQDNSNQEERSFRQPDNFSRQTQQESNQPFCSECGFDLKPNWVSCPNCGHRVLRHSRNVNKNQFY